MPEMEDDASKPLLLHQFLSGLPIPTELCATQTPKNWYLATLLKFIGTMCMG